MREVLKLLKGDGWTVVTIVGSHRQQHPTKVGRVTVAGHLADDIHPKNTEEHLDASGFAQIEFQPCDTQ